MFEPLEWKLTCIDMHNRTNLFSAIMKTHWVRMVSLSNSKVREHTHLVVIELIWPLLGEFWHINFREL